MNYIGLSAQIIAIDSSGEKLCPSLEVTYGPYDNIDAAYNSIIDEFGSESIPIGLTVGIKIGNSIKEYWFNGGTTLDCLVEKQTGGGSISLETIPTDIINNIFNSK